MLFYKTKRSKCLLKLNFANKKSYYSIEWNIAKSYLFGLFNTKKTIKDKLIFSDIEEANKYLKYAIKPSKLNKSYSNQLYIFVDIPNISTKKFQISVNDHPSKEFVTPCYGCISIFRNMNYNEEKL